MKIMRTLTNLFSPLERTLKDVPEVHIIPDSTGGNCYSYCLAQLSDGREGKKVLAINGHYRRRSSLDFLPSRINVCILDEAVIFFGKDMIQLCAGKPEHQEEIGRMLKRYFGNAIDDIEYDPHHPDYYDDGKRC